MKKIHRSVQYTGHISYYSCFLTNHPLTSLDIDWNHTHMPRSCTIDCYRVRWHNIRSRPTLYPKLYLPPLSIQNDSLVMTAINVLENMMNHFKTLKNIFIADKFLLNWLQNWLQLSTDYNMRYIWVGFRMILGKII